MHRFEDVALCRGESCLGWKVGLNSEEYDYHAWVMGPYGGSKMLRDRFEALCSYAGE